MQTEQFRAIDQPIATADDRIQTVAIDGYVGALVANGSVTFNCFRLVPSISDPGQVVREMHVRLRMSPEVLVSINRAFGDFIDRAVADGVFLVDELGVEGGPVEDGPVEDGPAAGEGPAGDGR